MKYDRVAPDVYFGRPGSLVTLPWPLGGVQTPYERQVSSFVTGSGMYRVSKLVGGSRLYTLKWNALGMDTYARIEAYDRGHNGVGPWALIDPSRINLLTANQSSATAATNTSSGFSTSATNHGTPLSNSTTTHIHRVGGPRSLRWHFTTAPVTFPVLTLPTVYSSWFGIPVVVGKSYVFSVWIKPDGDASITVAAKIGWYDAVGVQIGSDSSGGDIAVTTWTSLACVAVAPANAAYAQCRLVATGSTITTGASLYVDELQFGVGSSVRTWVPGTGVMPVESLTFSEDVPFDAEFRDGPTLVLREVVS